MITDISGFPEADYIRYTPMYGTKWMQAREFAFCYFNIDRDGSIIADYHQGSDYRRVPLTSFKQFVDLMTKSSHTFTTLDECEMDACLNLHNDPRFKDEIHKGRAWDNGLTFYWTEHKLNIRDGNKWYHVLDISDLSRDDGYKKIPLHSAEAVRDFTLRFIQFCLDSGLVVRNNLTWSSIAHDYLVKYVQRNAWPHWNDPVEVDFQVHFLQGSKGPHHGARAIGTFVGADFDRIRSHLSILSNMPNHARWCTNYIISKHYNSDALYASYWIKCNMPQLPFMPWRVRLDNDFTPEVYGEQSVVVLQPNLASAIKLLDLKEGRDFEVIKSYQVVSKDGGVRYPYRYACKRMLHILDNAPKDVHVKTLYQRFVGMMFHVIREQNDIIASNVFDPMLASTVWAIEDTQCWTTLMNSLDPQLRRVDGGTAGMPNVDMDKYTLGAVGTHLAFNQTYKDKTGETYFRDRITKHRDKSYLPNVVESRLSFKEAFGNLTPLSEVGKTILREFREHPGDGSRSHPEIKHVGELLDGTIITEVFSEEEAKEAFWRRQLQTTKLLGLR